MEIDPADVARLAVRRLEHLRWRVVALVLLPVHDDADAAFCTAGGVETGSERLVLGHDCLVGEPAHAVDDPIDVAAGLDTAILVGSGEDGPVQTVPRPAQSAFAGNRRGNRGVRRSHTRVDYVHAVLVLKGGVGALPRGDAAAAVAQEDV